MREQYATGHHKSIFFALHLTRNPRALYSRTMPLKLTPKIWLLALLLLAATIALTWKAKALEKRLLGDSSSTSTLVNKTAPDLQMTSLAGQPVSLQDFRGKKKVVVSFWASWCAPCRLELPVLQAFYEKYHPGDTFEILAVSTDEDRSE